MPSYVELHEEAVWRQETVPPKLAELSRRLQTHWPKATIGIKGDNHHLRGYHRSRAWVLGSRWCTNRAYSTTETPGNREGGDPRWLAALDLGLPRAELLAACGRLDVAVRAGRLEKVTQWYGNINGDERVDGYDNLRNRLASSSTSHLTHLHVSFDRGRVGEDHTDLFDVLTGGDDDMEQAERLLHDTGSPSRTVGDVLADVENLRNWIISPPGATGVGAPPPGSVGAILLSAAQAVLHAREGKD